ncbi:glycosyltransferase family 39 protein [Patescibacteria group bacterium]|nr:glycosyltransferase family 39 protein [Patescibacteria group bacterium]
MWQRIKKFIEKNEVLILILLVVVIMRIPGLFEPNRYADEDIYLALGQGLRKGLVFYRDIHDNKPPLLYLTAALAGNVMWFRFILMAWNLVNVVLIWKLAEKLIKSKLGVVLVTVLFAVLSSIPLIEGNIANGEVFMIMPTVAGVLLLLQLVKKKSYWKGYFWVGILFSVSFLFKVPALFELLTVMFWLFVYRRKVFNKRVWLVVIGFLIPVLLSIGYYWAMGAGEAYVRSALGQNMGYLSSWEGESKPFYESGLFIRGMIVIISVGVIWLLRQRLGVGFGLVALWFVGALFGAMLSGRPYPHYLIEIVPPGVLMLGMLMFEKKKEYWAKLIIGIGLIILTFWAVVAYKFWYYKSLPYYENFISYAMGKKGEEEYRRFFGDGVIRNYQVAEYILEMTDLDEKIFVWGTEPAIYVLSNRLPVGKYTVAYHILDFNASEETIDALLREKPRIIIKMANEKSVFDQLNGILVSNYALVKVIDEANIYLRYVDR